MLPLRFRLADHEVKAEITARLRLQPNEKDARVETRANYTEGVSKCQPRVELWQPWDQVSDGCWNPERVRFCSDLTRLGEPFQGCVKYRRSLSQGFKANPGLRLANTFGVKTLSGKQEVVGLLLRERQTIFRAPQLVYHSSAAAITRAALPPYDPAPMKI